MATIAVVDAEEEEYTQLTNEHGAMRKKLGSVIGIRSSSLTVRRYLDDEEFKRAFRMKREAYSLLLRLSSFMLIAMSNKQHV